MRTVSVCLFVAMMATAAFATMGFDECKDAFIKDADYPHEPSGAVHICRDRVIAISYDTNMVDPAWSAYYITPEELTHTLSGRDGFYEDPDLKAQGITQAAVDSDAWSTEWNRGHLGPNHILSYDEAGKKASFTMANVAPQEAYFNQHPWNYLEADVYEWVSNNNALHIVTGIAFKDRSNPDRRAGIAVPTYYWKVLCDVSSGESVGFLGENWVGGNNALEMRTVDSIQEIYGGRIFPQDKCKTDALHTSHWWSQSQLAEKRIVVQPPPAKVGVNSKAKGCAWGTRIECAAIIVGCAAACVDPLDPACIGCCGGLWATCHKCF